MGIKNIIRLFCLFLIVAGLYVSGCKKNKTDTVPPEPSVDTSKIAGLSTDTVTNVTSVAASIVSHIVSDGGAAVQSRGVCWSKTTGPTISNSKAEASVVKGSGEFITGMKDLEENTIYFVRAFAGNRAGIAYGNEISFITARATPPKNARILLDSTSFGSLQKFESLWNYLYPWGSDHNGSARMYKEQVKLEAGGVLRIDADRTEVWEGNSTADPWLRIYYHSGAIHLKEKITVSNAYPSWIISGDFQVPTMQGSWPAFWITGASSWPPESDIMEFKGDARNWQNTATGPNWQNVTWQNKLTTVTNPGNWHNYKIIMNKISSVNLDIEYYIDNVRMAVHRANFMDKPFWLIINMQMEGSSGAPGPMNAIVRARNVYVAAIPQ
jgi:galactan endo-beta-1,3-galactanase